ncbi:FAD-linked oxidase C-terminal domain-containing protein [Opitutales bacterium ASA1]|nr:FAD-linked oxidase C-terminal domain-containing protein [Opitutales bacterium ASA1]
MRSKPVPKNSLEESPHAAATHVLRARLGARVKTDADSLYRASFDGSKLSFLPEAVVVVKAESDIGVVLRLANEHRVPVTVRGGGTSLTGSGSPVRGGWVVDVKALDEIVIHADEGLAEVGVGARIIDIQEAAEAAGWFYPPDPSSRAHSTLGGNVACNAGGMHGAKYGVTRDFVLGLRGFLPNGEKAKWGGRFKKFACGYNLRDLWIGSEGTLGVVTSAVLRLVPKPAAKWTVVCAFEDEAAALAAVQALVGLRVLPSILEFLDRHSVQCAERATGESLFPEQRGRPLLLVEVDGSKADVRTQRAVVLEWARERAIAWKEAKTDAAAEKLWEVRRKCSGAMFELGDAKLNEDVVVPMTRQVDFAKFLDDLQRSSRLPIATFGHAADGNFHVNIMYHRDDAKESLRAQKAVERLMKKVVALGGTITGEHGIGLAKTPFLRFDRSEAEIEAMLAIKRALDPNGILNPGKIFERFQVWDHRPLKVKLPWDHK